MCRVAFDAVVQVLEARGFAAALDAHDGLELSANGLPTERG